MPKPVPVHFGDIMQAIEDRLLASLVAVDHAQILWAVNEVPPQLAAEFDIIVRARNALRLPQDGGPWDLRFARLVDISLRTQAIQDPGASWKTWLKAHFARMDGILDAIAKTDFQPTNTDGDFLTVKPIIPVNDLAPEHSQAISTWGDSVCTLEIHYLPLVTREQL